MGVKTGQRKKRARGWLRYGSLQGEWEPGSEMFLAAEGVSSDDGTGLSEEESEGPAGAEARARERRGRQGRRPRALSRRLRLRALGPGGRKIKVEAGMGLVGGSAAAGRPYKMWKRPDWLVTRVRDLRSPTPL